MKTRATNRPSLRSAADGNDRVSEDEAEQIAGRYGAAAPEIIRGLDRLRAVLDCVGNIEELLLRGPQGTGAELERQLARNTERRCAAFFGIDRNEPAQREALMLHIHIVGSYHRDQDGEPADAVIRRVRPHHPDLADRLEDDSAKELLADAVHAWARVLRRPDGGRGVEKWTTLERLFAHLGLAVGRESLKATARGFLRERQRLGFDPPKPGKQK